MHAYSGASTVPPFITQSITGYWNEVGTIKVPGAAARIRSGILSVPAYTIEKSDKSHITIRLGIGNTVGKKYLHEAPWLKNVQN